MTKITGEARREVIQAVQERYAQASKPDKSRILDEFVALTGFHRKHAIRVLNGSLRDVRRPRGNRARVYDDAVREALVVLWEASDRVCGKRLKPLLPLLISALERHGHLELDEVVRSKLLKISSSTIDRLLIPARATAKKKHTRRPPAARASIPVRTFADWNDPVPGHMEIDLVAHCGGDMSGAFVHTLVLTDIASGWIECLPLIARDSSLVVSGLEAVRSSMPFPLLARDSDNGSEFINESVLGFCQTNSIEFTRSRPRRKNDQAWVEQKNGAVVRRLVGYGRLSGLAAADSLSRLYASSRLFVNFFQPSFKLLSKERVGARVRKQYAKPATPCERLLESSAIGEETKARLQAVQVTLDPLRLLDEIRGMQAHIAGLTRGEYVHVPPHRDADLERFLQTLASAWKQGEVRPTHRSAPKPARHWRTRADPFEAEWPTVVLWLNAEPDCTAKKLFDRLREEYPGKFRKGQLRTLQRRVKDWRAAEARRLVFAPIKSNAEESAIQSSTRE